MRSRAGRGASWLMIFLTLCMQAGQVNALPSGQSVRSGDVKFYRLGDRMIIVQKSGSAIVNYGSFNIADSETVRFIQPGSSAAILNRVTGGGRSYIDGSLLANGQVYLINPNGILFGRGANVNVGSLVASAMNMSDSDFLSGRLYFSGGGGSVINEGNISAGRVYLVGGQVENNGNISAGRVALAAGQSSVLIDSVEGGEIRLVIDGQDGAVTSALDRVNYTQSLFDEALSNNAPTVVGAGQNGPAEEVAEAADGLTSEMADLANAETTGMDVLLDDGATLDEPVLTETLTPTGYVINNGSIDASGAVGGNVALRGERVGQSGAIHADGTVGNGGTIVIYGHDLVHVNDDSVTTVNAGPNGNGGAIVMYGENALLIDDGSKIEAKGGSESGDGGFVELSGAITQIGEYGDASAPNGKQGTLLIDPRDFWIDNLDTANIDFSDSLNAVVPTDDNAGANIGDVIDVMQEYGGFVVDTHTGGGAAGNIYLQANLNFDGTAEPEAFLLKAAGSIYIQNSIFDGSAGGDSLDIGLIADNSIFIQASINSAGGQIGLVANNSVSVGSSLTSGGGQIAIVSKNSNVSINSSVNSGSGQLIISANSGSVNVNSSLTSSGGDHSIYGQDAVTLSGNVSSGGGEVLVASGGGITINNSISTSGGRVSVLGNTTVTQNDGGDINSGGGDIAVVATNGNINMSAGATATSGNGDILYFGPTGVDVTGLNAGNGRIIVAGSQVTDAGNSSTDIRAFEAVVAATNGSIGMNQADGLDIDVDTLAGFASGSIRVTDSDNLTIGTVDQISYNIAGPTGVTYAFQIGPISGLFSTAGTEMSVTTLNGDLVVDAPTILAGPGTLTLDANGAGADVDINTFVASTNGAVVVRADADVIQNSAIASMGSITVNAGSDILMSGSQALAFAQAGSITYTAAQNIVSEEIVTSNGSVTLRAGGSVTQNGAIASLAGGSVIVAANTGSIRMAPNSATIAGNGSISYTAAVNIVAQSIFSSNGTVAVRAGGSVTQEAILGTLSGDVFVQAKNGGIRMLPGTNVYTAGGNITYTAADDIVVSGLGLLSTSGTIAVRSGNGITQDAPIVTLDNGNVLVQSADSTIRMTTNAVTLVGDGTVTYTAGTHIVAGLILTSNGNISVRAGQSVTQENIIASAGLGNVTISANSGSIRMLDQSNVLTFAAQGSITYTAAQNIVLSGTGLLNSNGSVFVRAGNAVTQDALIASLDGGNILVQSRNSSIIMTTSGVSVAGDGSITYTAAQNIVAQEIFSSNGNIFVRAGNSVTQESVIGTLIGDVLVQARNGGIRMLTASNVLTVAGGNITYTAADDIVVSGKGIISSNGSVFVRAGNAITQDAPIISLAGGNVLVSSADSTIRMTTNASTLVGQGTIMYTAATHIVTRALLTSNGNITVRAGQSITQESVIASAGLGDVLVQANSGSIRMLDASNVLTYAAQGSITYTGGQNIVISGKGLLNSNGPIFVRTGNAVTQNAVIASLDGGDILVQARNESIRMTTNAVTFAGNGDITYTAAVNIVAQEIITSNGNVYVRAGGSITQEAVIASVTGGDVLAQAANGDIFMVSNVLTVTGGGDIGYRAGRDMQIASMLTTNGQITAIAGDDILQVSNIYNLGTGSIDVEAVGGELRMNPGTISATLDGNIRYAALEDVVLGSLATTTGNVRVQSSTGSILDGGGTLPEIVAVNAQVSAVNGGVGITGPGSNDPIETAISVLAGEAGAGGINIINLLPLAIDAVPPIDVNRVGINGTPTVLSGTSLAGLTTTEDGSIIVLNASTMDVNEPVSGGGNANILLATITGATQTITVNAPVVSGSGNITVLSGDDVVQTAPGDIATVGGDIVVFSLSGDIAMADGARAESGGGDVAYISTSNIIVGSLNSFTGQVSAIAFNGDVLDGGDTDVDVIGAKAQLLAFGSVGTPTNGIESTVDEIAALSTDGIKITETDDVTIGTVGPVVATIVLPDNTTLVTNLPAIAGLVTTNGAILFDTIDGTISITNGVFATGAGNVLVDANGAGKDVVVSNQVVAANGNMSINADDSVFQYQSIAQTGTNKTIDVAAFTGSIVMAENAITFGAGEVRYAAAQDVTLGSIVSTSSNTVSVIAEQGSILDGSDNLQNIVSLKTRLVADDGIGSFADPIETFGGFLSARAGSGGIYINNDSILVIDTIPDVTVQRVNPDATTTPVTDVSLSDVITTNNGSIGIKTENGSIFVLDGVSPSNAFGVVADGTGNIALHANGTNSSLFVLSGIISDLGDICLQADKDFIMNAPNTGIGTGGKGSIAIWADQDENNVGNFLQLAGYIHTQTGNIYIAAYNVSQFGPSVIASDKGDIVVSAENNLNISGQGGLQSGGDLAIAAGNIKVGSLIAAKGTVAMRAKKDSITGKGRVVGHSVSLSARNSIGESDQKLTVRTTYLATHTDRGDVFLWAQDSVIAADVDAPRGLRSGLPECAKNIPIPFLRDLSGITSHDDMDLFVERNLSGNKVVAGDNALVVVDGSVNGLDLLQAGTDLELHVAGNYLGNTIRAGDDIYARIGGDLTFELMEAHDIDTRTMRGSINMGKVNASYARFQAGHAIHDNGSYLRANRVILIAGEDIGDNSPIRMDVNDIALIQAGGNIRIVQNNVGDTRLGLISAGGDLEINAPNGGFIDNNGYDLNIRAASAYINSKNLGTLEDPLEVDIGPGNLEVDGAGQNGDFISDEFVFVHLNGSVDAEDGRRIDYVGDLPVPGLIILNGQIYGGNLEILRTIARTRTFLQEVPVLRMPEGVYGNPYFIDAATPTEEAWELYIYYILQGQAEISAKEKALEKAVGSVPVGPSAKLIK